MMMMTRKFIIISESVLADEDDDADHKKKTLPATVRARVRRPREKKIRLARRDFVEGNSAVQTQIHKLLLGLLFPWYLPNTNILVQLA